MGADLNNIVKFQKLSDEHVQFLIYQLLRGLKVAGCVPLGIRVFAGLAFHANMAEIHCQHRVANTFTRFCLFVGRLFGLTGCHGADKSRLPLARA